MIEKSVKLIECFNSYQGEGVDSGIGMIILRFKTCNLQCPYCDTSVKMRISMEAPYSLDSIQKSINEKRMGILVTGGEPTVPRHFEDAVTLLNDLSYPVANVESNGFKLVELIERVNPTKNIHFIYSPKIFSTNDKLVAIEKSIYLLSKYHNVYIKIVYEDTPMINEYLNLLNDFIDAINSKGDYKLNTRVFLMPEGVTREELLKNSPAVFDACEKYKFNFSSRDHIIYGFI